MKKVTTASTLYLTFVYIAMWLFPTTCRPNGPAEHLLPGRIVTHGCSLGSTVCTHGTTVQMVRLVSYPLAWPWPTLNGDTRVTHFLMDISKASM